MAHLFQAVQADQIFADGKYLVNIFQGRIEYELIYSPRSAKHRANYSVHIR